MRPLSLRRIRWFCRTLRLLPSCWPMLRVLTFVAVLSVPTTWCLADLTSTQVARGKHATALVELPRVHRSGSAVCIDPSGFFLTNAHVVDTGTPSEPIQIILNPGEADQQVLPAAVVQADKDLDLALLHVTARQPLSFLELGMLNGLTETAPVAAFGYPFGTRLAEKQNTYPNVSVSLGHVTALRKVNGLLLHIQLDAALNPGNSGGPVLNGQGQVIGIVQAGIPGSGVNLAIPVSTVQAFLRLPAIVFTPPSSTAPPETPRDFVIHLAAYRQSPTVFTVTLILDPQTPQARTLSVPHTGGTEFRVRTPLLLPEVGGKWLQLTANSPLGTLICRVREQKVQINGQSLWLSQVRRFDIGNQARVVLSDGKTLSGALHGLDAVQAHFGAGAVQTLDLRKFDTVSLTEVQAASGPLNYKVEVRAGGTLVASTSGTLAVPPRAPSLAGNAIENKPGATPTRPNSAPTIKPSGFAARPLTTSPRAVITPPSMANDRMTVSLPSEVGEVGIGGGGRYLVLHLPQLHQVAIFDVNVGRITHSLSMASDDIALTASNEKLLVLLNDQGILQRWNLQTGEREANLPIPSFYPVYNISAGSASDGPVVLFLRAPGIIFLDIATLTRLEFDWRRRVAGYAAPHWGSTMRASANGRVFTSWSSGLGATDMHYNYFEGDFFEGNGANDACGYAVANGDGNLIYTSRGLYNGDMKPLDTQRFKSIQCVPTQETTYFLGVAARQGEEYKKVTVSVYAASDRRLICTLPPFEELTTPEQGSQEKLTLDKRLFFIPEANLIVTLADTRNQLVLRKFNVMEALERTGQDYLLVTSAPERTAQRGKRYVYQMQVKSRGGVQYHLDSGPRGMSVSPQGRLEWQVPAEAGAEENILVTVRSASGREIFHAFRLSVE